MLKIALLSTAFAASSFVTGCSSADDANPPEANAAAATVGHVSVPFCAPGESVILSCPTENDKMLSVCAKDVTKPTGYIEYRFGPTNASEKTVRYPTSWADKSEDHNPRYTLNFTSGNTIYQVYQSVDQHQEPETAEAGVFVIQNGRPLATVKCQGNETRPFDIQMIQAAGVRADP